MYKDKINLIYEENSIDIEQIIIDTLIKEVDLYFNNYNFGEDND